ncbi:hypothetical protein AMTR_s00039p00071790 [Amborella trichopoda]|uniref:Uncharacterized protein n=1 Tax=Amborella trichopoda TaxID=13333 RepID=U5CRB0_AMBTC|nr:hypothetical protein AMTR_s00039p00071790 [Amborella trichopoda]
MPNELPPRVTRPYSPHENAPQPYSPYENAPQPYSPHMNAKCHSALLPPRECQMNSRYSPTPPRECQMSLDCQLKKSQHAIHCQDNIQCNHIIGFFYSIHSSHFASMWDIYVS